MTTKGEKIMTIKELIADLENILKEHGDLEVETYGGMYDRLPINKPEIAYTKILSKKQSKPIFWYKWSDPETTKGKKVVKI